MDTPRRLPDTSFDRLLAADHPALVGRVTPGVLHEVNNPLAVVLGYAQALQQDLASIDQAQLQNVREDIDVIEGSAGRCRTLLRALHEFARPFPPIGDVTMVPLLPIIDAAQLLLSYAARREQTKVEFIPPAPADGGDVYVKGIRGPLLYLVVELMLNAIEATRAGSVELRLTMTEQEVQLEIDDSGLVLSAADLAQIFEPFHTTRPRGTGLGLPLSRWLCERFGGSLTLEPHASGNRATIVLARES